jgi:hypothetical protein
MKQPIFLLPGHQMGPKLPFDRDQTKVRVGTFTLSLPMGVTLLTMKGFADLMGPKGHDEE